MEILANVNLQNFQGMGFLSFFNAFLWIRWVFSTPEAPTENHGLFTHKVRDNGRPKAEHTEGVCLKNGGRRVVR